MYFKLDAFLVIVVMMTIHLARSAPSKVTPILNLNSNELGNKCLVLPTPSDSSLELLVKKHCYVDKTEYLIKMLSITQKFWFLSRPRRFGKTLLTKTMESFFKGEVELFKDTAIYQQFIGSLSNFNIRSIRSPKNPVIRLDFSGGIETHSFPKFEEDMIQLFRDVANLHNVHIDALSVPSATRQLIWLLHEKYNKEVVILIDEYDSPYTKSFSHNKDKAARILRTLQGFFSTLKSEFEKIRFCFTTGITRLALSDFFTGANAAIDLTMDPDYAGIVGFNETELRQFFGSYIEGVAAGKRNTTTEILNEMKKWHNGFRFTVKNESLYSPISVIGYLRSGGDLNYYGDTGGPSQLLAEKLKTFPLDALKILLNNDEINDGADAPKKKHVISAKKVELAGKYNFDSLTDSTALTALLFHCGYLSINSYDNTTKSFSLKFSNLEMKEDYAMRLYSSFTGQERTLMEKSINSMVRDLDESRWEPFILRLNSFQSSILYYLNVNQRRGLEAWFQFTMYLVFHFSTYAHIGKPLLEDATNKGRSDIILPMNNKMYIFEPKMSNNPENPVYECKVKYPQKHFFIMEEVVCVGLKFNRDGSVGSWGVATFSKEGKLIGEGGNITLTNELNAEENQKITNILTSFKKKHLKFTLQPDKLVEFLTQIGPTPEDEQNFAKYFTTDIKTMCTLLRQIKNELKSNLKFIINGFLNRNDVE